MDCRSCAAWRRAALSSGRLVGAGVRDLVGSDATVGLMGGKLGGFTCCLLYTSPSPRD